MGTTTHCTFCDGTEGRRILYKGQCLSECPISSVLKELPDGTLTCAECTDTEQCAICDVDDLAVCKKCINPFVLHNDVCLRSCPLNFKRTADGESCYPSTTKDIGLFYFPFLIAAFFGCLIAVFGKCKKSPGRTKYVSTQNTITSFIVIIAFIQFCAMIALIVWSIIFDTEYLFFAGCILIGLMILLNIIF